MTTVKLTFHKNTPANRKRYLKPGRLYLTIYSGAVNISRSIYHGEEGTSLRADKNYGWSGYDTAPFLTHLPPEAPSYFAQGEVDKIPGLKEVK